MIQNQVFHGSLYLPINAEEVPPGQPAVERAGPLLPALLTKTTPCLFTASESMSITRLKDKNITLYIDTNWGLTQHFSSTVLKLLHKEESECQF